MNPATLGRLYTYNRGIWYNAACGIGYYPYTYYGFAHTWLWVFPTCAIVIGFSQTWNGYATWRRVWYYIFFRSGTKRVKCGIWTEIGWKAEMTASVMYRREPKPQIWEKTKTKTRYSSEDTHKIIKKEHS